MNTVISICIIVEVLILICLAAVVVKMTIDFLTGKL